MSKFKYQPILEYGEDKTEYRLLTKDHVKTENWGGHEFLVVEQKALEVLAEEAFVDVSHLLRPAHLEKLEKILKDPEASSNDRYVATELLKNAVIAAEKIFPSCQDTGTAIVFAKKGEQVFTGKDDSVALSKGIQNTYERKNLRYSQMAPLSMYEEKNTKTNLPAQIDLMSTSGSEYKFLFMAKGGGSANKTYLYQKTKALLNPDSMKEFMHTAIVGLGTAACPPYHLAVVIGGTSADANLKTVKLASAGYLDEMPTSGNDLGRGYRDLELEKQVQEWAIETKIGAQFGGKYFVHDVRVIRLPRHGASCPVGIGVSCSADRNIKGKITKDGVFLEQLEEHPARFLPTAKQDANEDVVKIDLNTSMKDVLSALSKLDVATRVSLSGTIVVARDVAHAKLKERLDSGKGLPDYVKNFPIYYAGPAKTPEGFASGSFGPTTSQRMDPYVPVFQKEGASLVMLGKGNRSPDVAKSCKENGGFYLGSIGGPAALLGKECITKVEVLEYPELGMEAIWKIEVRDFPAFIIVDDKGNDFFSRF